MRRAELGDGFGALAGPVVEELSKGSFALATAASGIVGDIGSVLGGGKFENGAVTGAFAYVAGRVLEDRAIAAQKGKAINSVAPKDGQLYDVSAEVKDALAKTFGVNRVKIDKISVYEYSEVAKTMGENILATTRVDAIYLRGSGASFVSGHDLLLHEYYRVVRQWNTGELTKPMYIMAGPWEANRYEVAARNFAQDNISAFKKHLFPE